MGFNPERVAYCARYATLSGLTTYGSGSQGRLQKTQPTLGFATQRLWRWKPSISSQPNTLTGLFQQPRCVRGSETATLRFPFAKPGRPRLLFASEPQNRVESRGVSVDRRRSRNHRRCDGGARYDQIPILSASSTALLSSSPSSRRRFARNTPSIQASDGRRRSVSLLGQGDPAGPPRFHVDRHERRPEPLRWI